VILASLLVALTVVPAFCSRFLEAPRHTSEQTNRSGLSNTYERVVAGAIEWRWGVIAMSAAAAVASGVLLSYSGTELFPRVEAAQFQMTVRLPSGTRIEVTERTLARIEQTLMDELGEPDPEYPTVEAHPNSDLRMLITNIGVLMDWPAAYTPNTGPKDRQRRL